MLAPCCQGQAAPCPSDLFLACGSPMKLEGHWKGLLGSGGILQGLIAAFKPDRKMRSSSSWANLLGRTAPLSWLPPTSPASHLRLLVHSCGARQPSARYVVPPGPVVTHCNALCLHGVILTHHMTRPVGLLATAARQQVIRPLAHACNCRSASWPCAPVSSRAWRRLHRAQGLTLLLPLHRAHAAQAAKAAQVVGRASSSWCKYPAANAWPCCRV